jgi:hypothetical protein
MKVVAEALCNVGRQEGSETVGLNNRLSDVSQRGEKSDRPVEYKSLRSAGYGPAVMIGREWSR